MKKIFMFLAVAGLMTLSAQIAAAQDTDAAAPAAEEVVAPAEEAADGEIDPFNAPKSDVPLHQALKTKFIEGGAGFMTLVIICLILGLALSIERILTLSLAKVNTNKFLAKVQSALEEGGVEAAKEVCEKSNKAIPVIFAKALANYDKGLEFVEKQLVAESEQQELKNTNGLSWISLFIAIAPSLGFLGTVIGMIQAFDAIQAAGDISPNVVAGGMKVALITTVGGLIVAVILQLFYNYILSQVDGHSIDMAKANLKLVEMLNDNEKKNN